MGSRSSARDNIIESARGDLFGVAAGAAVGVLAAIIADAGRRYPDANLMATGCLGAFITMMLALLVEHGQVFAQCYPRNGALGYSWALMNGTDLAIVAVLQCVAVKYCPPVVFGLLSLMDLVLEPAVIWVVLGETPLPSTMVLGGLIMIVLAVHEIVAYFVELDDSLAVAKGSEDPPTESTPLVSA